MRIECVVVSVDCGDYLAATLPLNKGHFDRQLVITAPHDEETKRVCKHYNVECFVTDAFYRGGDKFNKGRAIHEALKHLDFQDWVIHQDADIVLPPLSRAILKKIDLNEQFLYGIDRVMCPSYDYWAKFLANPLPQHDQAYVHVGPFPVGTRVMKLEQGGWVPLGYFQLFHRNANAIKEASTFYPVEWDSAATSDLHFAYRWPRTHRHLLPEIVAIHLATDDLTGSIMGQNWEGRKSKRFEQTDPWFRNYRPAPKPDIQIKTKSS